MCAAPRRAAPRRPAGRRRGSAGRAPAPAPVAWPGRVRSARRALAGRCEHSTFVTPQLKHPNTQAIRWPNDQGTPGLHTLRAGPPRHPARPLAPPGSPGWCPTHPAQRAPRRKRRLTRGAPGPPAVFLGPAPALWPFCRQTSEECKGIRTTDRLGLGLYSTHAARRHLYLAHWSPRGLGACASAPPLPLGPTLHPPHPAPQMAPPSLPCPARPRLRWPLPPRAGAVSCLCMSCANARTQHRETTASDAEHAPSLPTPMHCPSALCRAPSALIVKHSSYDA